MAISEITGDFYGTIYSINGVLLVLVTGILGHNCKYDKFMLVNIP
jgi:hypothetical protein